MMPTDLENLLDKKSGKDFVVSGFYWDHISRCK